MNWIILFIVLFGLGLFLSALVYDSDLDYAAWTFTAIFGFFFLGTVVSVLVERESVNSFKQFQEYHEIVCDPESNIDPEECAASQEQVSEKNKELAKLKSRRETYGNWSLVPRSVLKIEYID